jgi:leader peptidase (prepilin peptidase) / N-methyltransferase
MPAAFMAAWAGTGLLIGTALEIFYRRLLPSTPAGLQAARLTAPPLTALAFDALTWRFGPQFELLPYSVFAALGVALSVIDLTEQRLPSQLIYPGIALLSVLLATSAILHSKGPDLLRAVAGMAVLTTFYLVLAVVSRGGLGAGDVKLGGLLGLALGWLSWPALLTATFLAWFTAALGWLILRVTRHLSCDSQMPMGPFLMLGTLLTITFIPI